jgi:hypothetical protein
MDHEILLHIIDGPGAGLTIMVLGFFALMAIIYSINAARSNNFQKGKEEARREGLENLQVTLAKLVHDQQEMKQKLFFTEPGE